jgi:Flp pilus assembly protein TadG
MKAIEFSSTRQLPARTGTGTIACMVRRLRTDETGQIIPWMAVLMTLVFFGVAAMVVDVGRGVVSYQKLQGATDAAALAAAQMMPTGTSQQSVIDMATSYSAVAGNANAHAGMLPGAKMVTGYPKLMCLTAVTNWGILCPSAINANAIQIAETVPLPMYFAGLMGFKNINITAVSTAAMRGSPRNPYNVAILIDTTGSMGEYDNVASSCNGTRISCSLEGVRTMLGNLSPCLSGSSCGTATNGNYSSPLDEVAIYTFPGMVSTNDVINDTTCGKKSVTGDSSSDTWGQSQRASGGWGQGKINYANYIFGSPAGSAPIYQLVDFSSDYATANPGSINNNGAGSSSKLNTKSVSVQAMGGKSGCSGIGYGGGTYYAATIYQAQADLIAQQQARLPQRTKNVMVILSDGDATAGTYYLGSSWPDDMQIYGKTQAQAQTTLLNTAGTYPSAFNQCQQGVVAAQAATAAGTTVYTVAYGTQASGCETDKSTFSIKVGTKTYKNSSPSKLTPCQAMRGMASRADTFYSDYTAAGNGGNNDTSCQGASQTDTKLNNIFAAIAGNLSTARLIPNNTQ